MSAPGNQPQNCRRDGKHACHASQPTDRYRYVADLGDNGTAMRVSESGQAGPKRVMPDVVRCRRVTTTMCLVSRDPADGRPTWPVGIGGQQLSGEAGDTGLDRPFAA